MSEAWGPHAHPERCDDEFQTDRRRRKDVAESLGTALGIVVLVCIGVALVLWWKGVF